MGICWTKCLVFYFLVLQHLVYLISAQLEDHTVAKVSDSWKVDTAAYVFNDGSIVKPIFFRETAATHMIACGFFCHAPCVTYLFAIFTLDRYYPPSNINPYNFLVVAWSANRNHPVREDATLDLTSDWGLVLGNADGSIAWSTNTSGQCVAGLNFTDTGNLVLFDDNNATVWQSSDLPTDCLLLGQSLMAGQKLTSTVSSSNSTELDSFSLSVTDKGLFASIDSNPPQVYYQLRGNATKTNRESNFVRFLNGNLALFSSSSASTEVPYAQIFIPKGSKAQYMRFGSDGHLRLYDLEAHGWTEVADLFTEEIDECSYPTVCGKYGICSNGPFCTCPEPTYFKPVNETQPNHGCLEITPLSCNASQHHSFLEVQGTSYFNFQADVENVTLETCKVMCLRNCSCKAVIFRYHSDPAMGNCYLPSQIFSLRNSQNSDYHSVYLKVQNTTPAVPQGGQRSEVKRSGVKRSEVQKILGFSIGSFIGLLILIGILVLLVWKRGNADEVEEVYFEKVPGTPTRFSYEDLKAMTGNFSKVLGEGGFGKVFEGTLLDGTKIAVKQLSGSGQVRKSFLTEVEAIGWIHHVNLVRLLGFCSDKINRILVYEYMSNGSLDKWIFHKTCEIVLDWHQKKKIILDIAKGLTYLHEECRQKIIHLDIKPQNILLDDNLGAKICDFGLSKLIERDQSKTVTIMRGTPGYLAPEWLNSVITEKVDTYSFGVVVLEILCGRRNFDQSQPEEQMHLLSLFEKKAKENRLLDLVNNNSEEMRFDRAEMMNIMRVAAWCLQRDYAKRPSMSMVVNFLEDVVEFEGNLDDSLPNTTLKTTFVEVTPLVPSVLSGPR